MAASFEDKNNSGRPGGPDSGPGPNRPKLSHAQGPLVAALRNVIKQVGIFALAGLLTALALTWLFAELIEDVLDKETATVDNNVSLWTHNFASPILDAVFTAITTVGSIAGVVITSLLIFGFLLLTKHRHSAWLLALAVGGGIALDQALKFSFQRPRPELWILIGPRLTSFSFPSGHATATMCLGGFLIWFGLKQFKKPAIKLGWCTLMVLWILLVGLSRIYLGLHYLTDVVGGFMAGGIWLVIQFSGVSAYDRFHQTRLSKSQEQPG